MSKFDIKGMPYRTFMYIFYYTAIDDGIPRIIGLFWEPGVFQLIANLYLFICINNGYKIKKMLWIILVVILTFSTTGFALLLFNMLLYLKKNMNLKRLRISFGILLLLFILIIPKVYNVVYFKWTNDLSGLIRQVNTIAGLKLTLAHPFVGVDANAGSLMNNPEFNKIEEDFWGENTKMISYNFGFVAGGFSNGNLSLILTWGTPIGFYLFILFFKSKFFPSSFYAFSFLFLFILTNMTEALTDTSLFYIFVISTFVLGRRKEINFFKNNSKEGFVSTEIEQGSSTRSFKTL